MIGYAFYGDLNSSLGEQRLYFQGIRANLELAATLYPDWTVRVYFDLADHHPVRGELCTLACAHSQLDICDVGKLPGLPMRDARKVFAANWRFFPILDEQVIHSFRGSGKCQNL